MSQKNLALIFSQINRVSGNNGLKAAGSSMSTIFILSCLVNVLFLTGPIFMMQVYDRVLGSGNIPTLIGLYAIALLLYIMMGLFDTLRQQIGTLRGEEVAAVYDGPAFQATLEANAAGCSGFRSARIFEAHIPIDGIWLGSALFLVKFFRSRPDREKQIRAHDCPQRSTIRKGPDKTR